MLELRRFQEEALQSLRAYLDKLTKESDRETKYNTFLVSKGKQPEPKKNIPEEAWKTRDVSPKVAYKTRQDGRGESIPHVCLKIPTGGGKTLLATHAVTLINHHYFKRNTGLVLWIVPSEAIYSQTLKNFKNYDHPYREVLDQAAPHRRALILERQRVFVPADVEQNFAVMMLMLQASARETKEQLRMFRDSGGYIDFFPAAHDYLNQNKRYREIPNLDVHQHNGMPHAGEYRPLTIKYSLGNVLRKLRPIVVIDEGHKAYSDNAQKTIDGFNPRFILELSATPTRERSNVLVDIPGTDLKNEQMIKLPIQLKNISASDWQTTLGDSCERLNELDKEAKTYHSQSGNYIRPILLVRVERTGSDQRGRGLLHAEDVREYLTEKLGFRPHEVRVKGGGKNEIADDDLLSSMCPVRVVITKAALQEGWDCPFAYVLALLDTGTANTALTQMIGRVLRQPYAQATGIDDLDRAHVFCFDQNVGETIEKIHKVLKREGLGDLYKSAWLYDDKQKNKLSVFRREKFRGHDIVFPQVLHKEGETTRLLSYERDILSGIDWRSMQLSQKGLLLQTQHAITEGLVDDETATTKTYQKSLEGEANATFFARHLSDLVPNPWQAMRIAREAMPSLKGSKQDIYNNRMNTVAQMRREIEEQRECAAKKLFRAKLGKKEIVFDLDATRCGWRLPHEVSMEYEAKPKYLVRETNDQLALSLFESYQERDFNQFEKKVAGYLDEAKAIDWWHRVAARREYGLQGWRKHLVYPDFVALISNDKKHHLILETKGKHLAGNEDTKYKEKLFEILEQNVLDAGSVKISNGVGELILQLIFECNWKETLERIMEQEAKPNEPIAT